MSKLEQAASERILVIDGAMGTMIQRHKLSESDFRGVEFAHCSMPQKGNNDLLVLTKPDVIKGIHRAFLDAGADILETNTFNANRISMADYGMEDQVVAINQAAVKVAREAIAESGKLAFVAGAVGPTNKTLSLSPDVNNPGYRAVTFDQMVEVYGEQAEALLDAGVDALLVETVFDTLNCKAALFAIDALFERKQKRVPLMVSGTITDASGRTLSGQTTEAFWNSIAHADLFSVGLNCALGASQMRPFIEELNRVAWTRISCYPNAGLPNEFGEYDETPHSMAFVLEDWLREGWINVIGGCCGTTPEHIASIAQVAAKFPPRKVPQIA